MITGLDMKKDTIQIHRVSGKDGDSFVGLSIEKDIVHIYTPESYPLDISNSSFSEDVISLFRSFNNNKWSDEKDDYPNKVSNGPSFDAFESYLWIIKDYISNGIPLEHLRERKKKISGKINWKRTIQYSDPIISGCSIIYDPLITERLFHSESLFSQIYKKCLNLSLVYFGWLYGLDPLDDSEIIDSEKKRYLTFLNNRLLQTYTDRGKILIQHLVKIISGVSEIEKRDKLQFGVNEYYHIFETLVDYYFGNVSKIDSFYPGASWYLKKQNYIENKCNPLRPDTVIINEKEAYVLDSKYYRYGCTASPNSLPDTSSIQKQITYGDYIKNNNLMGINTVYNIFLLPYDKTKRYYHNSELFESSDNIQFIGYAKTDWRKGTESHEIVYAFLIDLKYLVKQCQKGYKGQDSTELMSRVKEIKQSIDNDQDNQLHMDSEVDF